MAKIIQPEQVVRLDPQDKSNQLYTWGFRFHLAIRDGKKTACGIVLEGKKVDWCAFAKVKPKQLCSNCFRGLEIVI